MAVARVPYRYHCHVCDRSFDLPEVLGTPRTEPTQEAPSPKPMINWAAVRRRGRRSAEIPAAPPNGPNVRIEGGGIYGCAIGVDAHGSDVAIRRTHFKGNERAVRAVASRVELEDSLIE